MDPILSLWAETLARQEALRGEVARDRLAALVSKQPRSAFRAVLARGLRDLANRLDGPLAALEQSDLLFGDSRGSYAGLR